MAKKEAGGSKEISEKEAKGKEAEVSKEKPSGTTGVARTTPYELNAKVLCKHNDNLYYEAKIISVERFEDEYIYLVHYQGWNQRHDEKIAHSKTAERFLAFTPGNAEWAKEQMRVAQARMQQGKKKSKKSGIADEKKSGGPDSRASTPSDKRGASSSRAASITSEKVAGATPTASSVTSSSTSRKRKQPGEVEPIPDFVRKEEIKIEIPSVLKDILVDDQDLIVRQMYLYRLPARHTIASIIKQYADYMGSSVEARDEIPIDPNADESARKTLIVTLIESSLGVQEYFDSTLGSQLLYKFERPQYSDLIESCTRESVEPPAKRKRNTDSVVTEEQPAVEKKLKPSEHYGFVHLLRLFVRFGSMLSLTSWSDRSIQAIVSHVQCFLKFLEANRHRFYDVDNDYEIASPEYQRRVWTT